MEKDKNMMVGEDFIKEPPAVVPSCQKKSNGSSELGFSQRNSSVAKPECTIRSSTVSLKGKDIVSKFCQNIGNDSTCILRRDYFHFVKIQLKPVCKI